MPVLHVEDAGISRAGHDVAPRELVRLTFANPLRDLLRRQPDARVRLVGLASVPLTDAEQRATGKAPALAENDGLAPVRFRPPPHTERAGAAPVKGAVYPPRGWDRESRDNVGRCVPRRAKERARHDVPRAIEPRGGLVGVVGGRGGKAGGVVGVGGEESAILAPVALDGDPLPAFVPNHAAVGRRVNEAVPDPMVAGAVRIGRGTVTARHTLHGRAATGLEDVVTFGVRPVGEFVPADPRVFVAVVAPVVAGVVDVAEQEGFAVRPRPRMGARVVLRRRECAGNPFEGLGLYVREGGVGLAEQDAAPRPPVTDVNVLDEIEEEGVGLAGATGAVIERLEDGARHERGL